MRAHCIRRRGVAAATLVLGATVLGFSLRITPGDPSFYWATLLLAVVWAGGGLLAGPLHVGRVQTRAGARGARPVVQPLVVGGLLLAVFSAGAVVVARIPVLADPVRQLLEHARQGSLPVIVSLVIVNGLAEELYFRGALFAAIPARHAVWATTMLYAAVTAASGVPLLGFAGLVLGYVTALQRRATAGVLAPIVTHLTWTVGMVFLLPILLRHAR